MSAKTQNRLWAWTGLYGAIFFCIMWAAYTNQLPVRLLGNIPYSDKFFHLVLYAIASYLGHRVLKYRYYRQPLGITTLRLPLFPSLFGVFTLVEELIQGLAPYRSLDALDLVFSFLGVAAGYWWAEHQRKRGGQTDSHPASPKV